MTNKKRLIIPQIYQPAGSAWCVPTCALMAIRALGYDASLTNLVWAMRTKKLGTRYNNCAAVLNDLGFEVTYQHYFGNIFPKFANDQATLEEKINFYERKNIKPFPTLIKNGVNIIPRMASIMKIHQMVKNGHVAIASVRPNVLTKSTRDRVGGGHAVIVKRVDFNQNRVYITDPANNPRNKPYYTIDQFEASRTEWSHVLFVRNKKKNRK